MASAEQQARDMLDRMGVPDAQSYSSGDLVELANLIAANQPAPPPSLLQRMAWLLAAFASKSRPGDDATPTARAAIREVAAWIDERDLQIQNEPDACDPPTADDAVRWLRDEANQ